MFLLRLTAIAAFLLVYQKAAAEERLNITASIPPIASIVRSVVKSKGICESVLDRNMDHHLVELRPSDVLKLSNADLIVLNGLGLETWARSIPKELSSKTFEVFRSKLEAKGDVHAWLSPSLVVQGIPNLSEVLCKLAPESCGEIKENSNEAIKRINSIRDSIRSRAAKLENKDFLADHSTWKLFADDMGLNQLATLRASGHEDTFTIKDLVKFTSRAKTLKRRVFVIEPSTNMESIKSVVKDLSLIVVELDPLGSGNEDYGVFIEKNADKLLLALEGR